MEIMNGVLFAVQDEDIVGYDLTTETEVTRLTIPGAVFLNGLTNDGTVLFVTDFSTRKIYLVDVSDLGNPFYSEFVSNTIDQPNGIVYDENNNRLVYVCWGGNAESRAVDRTTQEVSLIINSGLGNLDGIDEDSDNNFYVSSWNPARITKYNNDFTTIEIVPTQPLNSPADIGYSQDTNIIAIPIFSDVIFFDTPR